MRRFGVILGIVVACVAGAATALFSEHDIPAKPAHPTDIDRLEPGAVAPLMVAQVPLRGDTVSYPYVPEIEIVEYAAVDEMVFCAVIKDRTPVTVADTFPSDISAIYCFTRIVGAQDTTAVIHSWYHGDTMVSDVNLAVKSPLWRTWSRKKINPAMRGEWRVEVIAPDGSVIASKKFFIE